MSNLSKNIQASIAALHAVDLALNTYASSAPAHELIEKVRKALEAGGGDLGKDVSLAIQRSLVAPSARSAIQFPKE